jgi:3-methyladenine DNA glycosylase AlkD
MLLGVYMSIQSDLRKLVNPKRAKILARFFKTGKGDYAEGDVFLGLTAAQSREIVKKHYPNTNFKELQKLLKSKIHEDRSVALGILFKKYEDSNNKKKIVNFYLKNLKGVNNWDLVDGSADKILGSYLIDKDKSLLYKLAKSKSIWERRIAIIATFWFIRDSKFDDTIKIIELLLDDKHDLIHKACGWMLREVGKRNVSVLRKFLRKHHKTMPRTMLRYSIERFSKAERKKWM